MVESILIFFFCNWYFLKLVEFLDLSLKNQARNVHPHFFTNCVNTYFKKHKCHWLIKTPNNMIKNLHHLEISRQIVSLKTATNKNYKKYDKKSSSSGNFTSNCFSKNSHK